MITLLGLFAPTIAFAVIMWHDTAMKVELPVWVMLLAAASVFFYQTMDAIDGK